MDTTGPGRLKISFWTPPTVNTRTSRAVVAQAAQPWPRQMASISSSFGISTVHSLLASQEPKWMQWSLLRQRQRTNKHLNIKKMQYLKIHQYIKFLSEISEGTPEGTTNFQWSFAKVLLLLFKNWRASLTSRTVDLKPLKPEAETVERSEGRYFRWKQVNVLLGTLNISPH